jgi:SOS response regulatory protein OraA/RecX
MGYNKDDVDDLMTLFMRENVLSILTKKAQGGILTEAEARKSLSEAGYSKDEIEYYIAWLKETYGLL